MTVRLIEHTADMGIHVEAGDLNSLFEQAGEGLFMVIVGEQIEGDGDQTVTIQLQENRLDFLMVDWLNELLVQFELKRMLFARFDVCIEGSQLAGRACGRSIDPNEYRLAHEVKAVTYHGLSVRQNPDGWSADVIVDI